ncbi:DNA polymerase I [Treponema sp.]|uniref:DNA polymerase I n=1 Tax=Treponema sp. TaxID=166 RepID=UPI00298E9690|nr:DNA polymerase I [Treponema sp.]MCQ2241610.1 DNA polymerase I [Treponema sp.]
MSNNENTVYILDSYGLIYRAYFALMNHPLTNSKGENISAVVIFFRNLKALLDKYKPSYLAAAFDSRTKTFRHEMFPEYKANREKTPEDLHAQVPWIEEILEAFGVPVLRADTYEADDIIATVARKCAEENRECRILSGDKDLLQLVTETCKEMQPDKANGGWDTMGVEEVKAKWGIGPDLILDYLSLVGDSADNVPGVKGVGEKTALKLLNEYGSLDGIGEHRDEIKGALGEKIRADWDNAGKSKELIKLVDDAPVEIDFEKFSTATNDFSACAKALSKYGAYAAAKAYDSAKELPAENKPSAETKEIPQEEVAAEVKQNKGSYRAVTVLSDLTDFVDSFLSSKEKVIAFDTETDGLETYKANLVGFSLCHKKGEGIYVPVVLAGGMFAPPTISKKDCLMELEKILCNPKVTVVMHNGKFDIEILKSNGMEKEFNCRIFDTMIAAWLLNPGASGKSPFSLEYLGETKLGLKGIEFKDLVKKGQTFADVPLEQAAEYGAEDSDFTFQLYDVFAGQIKEKKLADLYEMEMKVLPILVDMELEGIHLDKNALKEYSVELARLIEDKEKEIHGLAGHEFNIASTKQLQTVLFEEKGFKTAKKTKTGYSTDTAVLEELAETTDDPLPKVILDYRSYTKLQSTYVEALPVLADKNGRIHTSFLQTGTATGRLSSRDPNLQNIPVRDDAGRRIRSAFTAMPGKVLISADYSQIELVVLAHLSGDKNLSSAFINGIDVHKSTAALVYNKTPDEVTPEQRRFAKTVNFGVMYGMSAFRLANELNISRTEAKNFIEQYFMTYSSVKKFLDDTKENAKNNGYVETITGRRRYIPEIRSSNKMVLQGAERIAINTPIQGSAADIVKTAMINVSKKIKETESPLKMLLQVHDELIFECPDDESEIKKAVELIQSEMENAFALNVPLRVSIEYGRNWGEFH